MTNKERQSYINKKIKSGTLKLGKLPQCSHCGYLDPLFDGCFASDYQIKRNFVCAKAYNRREYQLRLRKTHDK